MDSRIVGVLGGGQLGRMMVNAGNRLGVRMSVLDPGGSASSAGQISHLVIEGSFTSSDSIIELSKETDLITTEIEHVDTNCLRDLEHVGVIVRPNAKTLESIQDKFKQKKLFQSRNITQPGFVDVPTINAANDAGRQFGFPFILKCKRLAYDGKGNAVVKTFDDLEKAFASLNGGRELYAEQMVPFAKELAVMVVRTADSSLLAYPVVETVQVNNVCHLVIAPAQVAEEVSAAALALALEAAACFDGVGIYGVELFLLGDDSVLVNEIAPRPHNSGHYSIEACDVDQFEMHLRAVLGLPCPLPRMRVPFAAMLNILGEDGDMEKVLEALRRASAVPGCAVHWYGKTECRAGRKMAHVTVTAESRHVLKERLELLGVSAEQHGLVGVGPRVGIVMGSDSDLQVMRAAAEILDAFGVRYELTIVSAHRTPTRMFSYAQTAAERGLEVLVAGAGGAAHLPGMVAALTTLPVVGVPVGGATLGGSDALLSIVQMPRGVPVATVGINNGLNAGLLAVRILACRDPLLTAKLLAYSRSQEEEVLAKADRLEELGHFQYLAGMSK